MRTAEEIIGYIFSDWVQENQTLAQLERRVTHELSSMQTKLQAAEALAAQLQVNNETQVTRIIEQENAIRRLQEALTEEEFQRKYAEDLAASRLVDQEAIERHTRRVVAEECCKIAEVKGINQDCFGEPSSLYRYGRKVAEGIVEAIRAKFGEGSK